jgi:hypothetical protein
MKTHIIFTNTNLLIPLSGICQILTTQSSDPLAITLSLCGHQAISSTGPLCPPTRGWSGAIRPTYTDKEIIAVRIKGTSTSTDLKVPAKFAHSINETHETY